MMGNLDPVPVREKHGISWPGMYALDRYREFFRNEFKFRYLDPVLVFRLSDCLELVARVVPN
jgi:hypothetical protein